VSSNAARRHAWLELLQQSGPFLTVPVADRIWPAGLPAIPAAVRTQLRAAVSELLATSGASRQEFSSLVLRDALGWSDALAEDVALPAALTEVVAEHGVHLRPDFAFRFESDDTADDADGLAESPAGEDEQADDEPDDGPSDGGLPAGGVASDSPWRMLGMWVRWGSHPLSRYVQAGWAASPVERLGALLRARDIPVGLISDGRWWSLVWAPRGRPVGAAVWDATLWSEEPESLEAFVALLDRRRFLGVPPAERLPALLEQSAQAQEDVTTALGGQVRAAVEMLVTRLDELNRQADGAILNGVSDDDLYAGVVTIMMRIVFLLFAEERRLLPSDDSRYDSSYSVGRLVEQLERRAAVNGEQTLEHRTGAWHRLLALARALHGGVAHEDLRLPPYGGGLFDPDRFPWLEGRGGAPPPVDDLTVLRMLEAVQYVRLHGERRRLTFRALDVEQIGYVYEGLLELEVRTAAEPVLGVCKQGRKGLALVSLSHAVDALTDLIPWVASTYVGEKKATPTRLAAAERRLAETVPATTLVGLRDTLGPELASQLEPLAALLRCDDRDRPSITPTGGRYVAPSTRRASTGAYYTPRSLAEEIGQHALEPLIYRPGPLDTLDRSVWILRPSTDLLALKIADIAMGSGAFLVAACRFLADRVVEAWEIEGDVEATRALAQRTEGAADAEVEGAPLRARRLVAEHCLYGVDVNPLAVEMAKLSLWLVTMDRERPFGFLDDRLVCGDSLLGITSTDQLETLHLDPVAGRRLREGRLDYSAGWRNILAGASDTRRRITATPVVTVRDVEHKMRLLDQARAATAPLATVADALTAAGLQAATRPAQQRHEVFTGLETGIWAYEAKGDTSVLDQYAAALQAGLPPGKEPRRTLHWPLVFPEVFADAAVPGFDAIIGNPPFLGGRKISGPLGDDYLAWLATWDGRGVTGSTDLAARFVLRADALLSPRGQLGYVTTNTLIEGATLKVGLLQLEKRGWIIRRGVSSHPWPSASANLSIVEVWASKAPVAASPVLDGEPVPRLSVDLQPYLRETGRPAQLDENDGVAFQGHLPLGDEFTLTPDEAQELLEEEPNNEDVLFPFLIGADLNRRPDTSASRWIVNFREWDEDRARLYVGPWNRLERNLKPKRITKNATKYPRMVYEWWKYWRYRQPLQAAIDELDRVLAISRVGNVLLPVRVPSDVVFSEACVVFALDDYASLALLSSSTHQVWVIRYTSTLETRIRYALSDVFLTFPRPEATPELHELGETIDAERREVMLERATGLTKLYNQVHDPAVIDPAIVRLREVHKEIDLAVLRAYGWTDLDPEIGHHLTKIGTRWTFSPRARFEVLDRLLVENHRRVETA
jgi:hypothetical protein